MLTGRTQECNYYLYIYIVILLLYAGEDQVHIYNFSILIGSSGSDDCIILNDVQL